MDNGDFKERVRKEFQLKKGEIHQRLEEFKNVKKEEYFYEMIYCLLTPQSSARNADLVVKKLKHLNFHRTNFNPEEILADKNNYIRFHKTKAERLIELKENFHFVQDYLTNGKDDFELREWLVKNIKGLGYKEASHFLRNIGKRNLAILDRHILKNLKNLKVIRDIPKTLTKKKYLYIEKKFKRFSEEIGITMDELDLLFWSMETGEILK